MASPQPVSSPSWILSFEVKAIRACKPKRHRFFVLWHAQVRHMIVVTYEIIYLIRTSMSCNCNWIAVCRKKKWVVIRIIVINSLVKTNLLTESIQLDK